jgi:deoxycytidine triphosphate deaminase
MLTDNEIKQLIAEKKLDIEPYDPDRLGPVSYDLTTHAFGSINDVRQLTTAEVITMPRDLVGILTPRSRLAVRGLFASFSLLVDPGFKGHLIFLVFRPGQLTEDYNVSDLFQIMFMKIGSVGTSYDERPSSTAMGRNGF